MTQIVRARSTGKTRELILEASKHDNAFIVCRNPQRMQEKIYAYGVTNVTAIGYEYFQSYPEQIDVRNLFIDEAEDLLKHLTDAHVCGYTLSLE